MAQYPFFGIGSPEFQAFAKKWAEEHPEEQDGAPYPPTPGVPPLPDRNPEEKAWEDSQRVPGYEGYKYPSDPNPRDPIVPDDIPSAEEEQPDYQRSLQQPAPQFFPPPPPSQGSPFPGRRIEANAGLIDPSILGGGGQGLLAGGSGLDALKSWWGEGEFRPLGSGGRPPPSVSPPAGPPAAGNGSFDLTAPPAYPSDMPSIAVGPRAAPHNIRGGGMPDPTLLDSVAGQAPHSVRGGPDVSLLGSSGGDILGGGEMDALSGGAPADDGSNPSFFNKLFGGGGNDRFGTGLSNIGAILMASAGGDTAKGAAAAQQGSAIMAKLKEQQSEDEYRKAALKMKQAELDKPEPPIDAIQKFEYARAHGYTGTPEDLWKSTGGGTNINIGDDGSALPAPDAGMVYAHTPEGKVLMRQVEGEPDGVMAPVQVNKLGGKVAEAAEREATNKATTYLVVEDNLNQALDKVVNKPGVTGFVGGVLKNIDGSDAANLKGNLDTIEGNLAIDKLTEIRKSSPNGAGLGNITNADMDLLKQSFGSLKQSNDAHQLELNLRHFQYMWNHIVWKDNPPSSAEGKPLVTGKTPGGLDFEVVQ